MTFMGALWLMLVGNDQLALIPGNFRELVFEIRCRAFGGGGVVLIKVVGKVGVFSLPEDEELALLDSILDPIAAHVDGF